jgi:glycosyltransferase involved in cell wall biosynthesis
MKIAALTMVCNEALILPYFLRHYEYLDEIHVIYETDSTDETLNILNKTPKVVVINGHIESGFDDTDKVNLLNSALADIKADWVYVVDSDEFIFPPNESPQDFLNRQSYDVVRAAMFQVYRHKTDKDLDPSLPPISQRIHGDPDIFSTVERPNRDFNANYIKPIVVRPSSRIRFKPGNHAAEGTVKISPEFYMGAHWQMADTSIAINRRMKNRARMSERNKALGMTWQHWSVTEEWIKAECKCHLDDPIIKELVPVEEKSPAEVAALSNRSFIQEALIVELRKQLIDSRNHEVQLKNQIDELRNQIVELRNISGISSPY